MRGARFAARLCQRTRCQGDAVIAVPGRGTGLGPDPGDKSLLVPGSLVTVAMTKTQDNKRRHARRDCGESDSQSARSALIF